MLPFLNIPCILYLYSSVLCNMYMYMYMHCIYMYTVHVHVCMCISFTCIYMYKYCLFVLLIPVVNPKISRTCLMSRMCHRLILRQGLFFTVQKQLD